MRKMLKALSICLCLALVNVSSLPNVTINKAEAKVKKPKLSKTSLELQEGKNITVRLNNATAKKVKWSSDNKTVATVSKGKIKGIAFGNATIIAKYKNKSYKCKVTVKKFNVKYVTSEVAEHTSDGCDLIKYTNNNDYDISIKVITKCYDSDGNVTLERTKDIKCLKNGVTYSYCIPNEKQTIESIKEEKDVEKVDKLETKYEFEEYNGYNKLNYYITNPTDQRITGDIIILYYEGSTALEFDWRTNISVSPNETIKGSFEINPRVTSVSLLAVPCQD